MVQTIKDMAKGFFHGKLIDLVDEELVSNSMYEQTQTSLKMLFGYFDSV